MGFAAQGEFNELTGDCPGEGFLEEDEGEVVDEDDLRYGFVSIEPAALAGEDGPRQS